MCFVSRVQLAVKFHSGCYEKFRNSHVSQQPEQHILAHKSEQPSAGWIAIFHKYCCYIKLGGIITNLNLWNFFGYVTDMSKCHAACVCRMDWNIHYALGLKTYSTFDGLFWSPAGSRRAARGACICETRLLTINTWWQQAITSANVDLSLVKSLVIHLRAVSVEMLKIWLTKMYVKSAHSKLVSHPLAVSELSWVLLDLIVVR